MPPGSLIQRRPPMHFGSDRQHRHQGDQAEAIDPMHRLQQPVVVDQREDEHRGQPAEQPEDLLGFEPDKLGVQGGAIDLKDADHRKQQHQAQEQPVEIAK